MFYNTLTRMYRDYNDHSEIDTSAIAITPFDVVAVVADDQ